MKVFIVAQLYDSEDNCNCESIVNVYAEQARELARSHARRIWAGTLHGPFEVLHEMPAWVLEHLPDPE